MALEGTRENSNRAQDHGHISSLDGIRGFALLLVVAYHVQRIDPNLHLPRLLSRAVATGWAGVDLFFVLSGFLITTILLDARPARNYFKVFYVRRCLRILPLYYLVLLVSLLTHPGHYGFAVQIFFWLNLSNLSTAFTPYAIPYLAHFWSLAIEEQFYFVWPAVVRYASPLRVAYICATVIVGLFIVRNLPPVLALQSRWPELIYRLTPFRVDTLCGGALLAATLKLRPDMSCLRLYFRGTLLASGAIFMAAGFGQDHESLRLIRFGYTSLVVFGVSLIALALYPGGLTGRLFSNPFLRKTGKYSYCFYLIHTFLLTFVAAHHAFILTALARVGLGPLPNKVIELIILIAEIATLYAICALSWNFFEGPILRLKRHFRYTPAPEFYLA
jgi:peptidoglycan/LPS O-acetylase OafA/YrhL